MATITQDKRRIQTDVSEDAHERLRIKAAKDEVSLGDTISELVIKHLPAPPKEIAATK